MQKFVVIELLQFQIMIGIYSRNTVIFFVLQTNKVLNCFMDKMAYDICKTILLIYLWINKHV